MKKHTKHRVAAVVSPIAISLLKLHTRITGRQRARVVVFNEQGEVLLVKGYVGRGWSLPGGGIEKGETPTRAAARELYEETGIQLNPARLTPLAILKKPEVPINYIAHIFTATTLKDVLPEVMHNPRELIEAEWHNPQTLPGDTTLLTRVSLARLSKQRHI